MTTDPDALALRLALRPTIIALSKTHALQAIADQMRRPPLKKNRLTPF
jgi:hypothetical protein